MPFITSGLVIQNPDIWKNVPNANILSSTFRQGRQVANPYRIDASAPLAPISNIMKRIVVGEPSLDIPLAPPGQRLIGQQTVGRNVVMKTPMVPNNTTTNNEYMNQLARESTEKSDGVEKPFQGFGSSFGGEIVEDDPFGDEYIVNDDVVDGEMNDDYTDLSTGPGVLDSAGFENTNPADKVFVNTLRKEKFKDALRGRRNLRKDKKFYEKPEKIVDKLRGAMNNFLMDQLRGKFDNVVETSKPSVFIPAPGVEPVPPIITERSPASMKAVSKKSSPLSPNKFQVSLVVDRKRKAVDDARQGLKKTKLGRAGLRVNTTVNKMGGPRVRITNISKTADSFIPQVRAQRVRKAA